MSLYYINATRKPNQTNYQVSELEGYQVCPSEIKNGSTIVLTSKAKYYSKASFFMSSDFNTNDVFKTWNNLLKITALITIEKSSNNELYLKSNPNNTTKDNLQELPDC